ncbi:MAG: hypothetical protein LH647_17315 [Leptolyngbyaceae cyanobacterium CAN_BIN12]|nr:hypothetical protein [Leptolyngbyaceae cyanobacterium CAN_BIN12]
MLNYIEERLLILTKTYPIPSGSHIETTCVAAVNDKGKMRRLYPIPFRLLEQESQFRKWQWIEANIDRASSDKRPESYRVDVDSIILKESVDTKNGWAERRRLFQPHLSDSFSSLEARRISTTQSFGILRVSRLITLEIEANKELEWNEKRRGQLAQQGLLHSEDIKNRA